jgi:hypothetical protein
MHRGAPVGVYPGEHFVAQDARNCGPDARGVGSNGGSVGLAAGRAGVDAS